YGGGGSGVTNGWLGVTPGGLLWDCGLEADFRPYQSLWRLPAGLASGPHRRVDADGGGCGTAVASPGWPWTARHQLGDRTSTGLPGRVGDVYSAAPGSHA